MRYHNNKNNKVISFEEFTNKRCEIIKKEIKEIKKDTKDVIISTINELCELVLGTDSDEEFEKEILELQKSIFNYMTIKNIKSELL